MSVAPTSAQLRSSAPVYGVTLMTSSREAVGAAVPILVVANASATTAIGGVRDSLGLGVGHGHGSLSLRLGPPSRCAAHRSPCAPESSDFPASVLLTTAPVAPLRREGAVAATQDSTPNGALSLPILLLGPYAQRELRARVLSVHPVKALEHGALSNGPDMDQRSERIERRFRRYRSWCAFWSSRSSRSRVSGGSRGTTLSCSQLGDLGGVPCRSGRDALHRS